MALGLKDIVLHIPEASDADVLAIASQRPPATRVVPPARYRGVTNALLGDALRWPKLRFLDVVGTQISEEALDAFVPKRPEVRVLPRKVQVRTSKIKPK